MKNLLLLLFLSLASLANAQNSTDSLQKGQSAAAADDPSQFFTRIELYNEILHYKNGVYLNQTVLRSILKVGKRFTTRIDVPLVYNSVSGSAGYKQFGLGDISFRLLGYKIMEKRKSAVTASIEISLNTAESPLLGTGKNLVIPVVTCSRFIPREKILLALVFQQANSFSGDEARANISFSKIQMIGLKIWSPKMWTVAAPEWYIDYVHGGLSMNLKSRFVIAPSPRINIWATAGAGIFGDFAGRYQWTADLGGRCFLFRNKPVEKK